MLRPSALAITLLIAFVIRAVALWTQVYVVFLDETFQYFEQAHRIVFGTGALPWEFLDGIRSWFLPGLIAAIMRLTALLTDEPMAYIRMTRLFCAGASLSVVYVGYRMAEQRDGQRAAILTAGLCAIWFDLIWFAPAVMTEVLATHAALLALWLNEPRRDGRGPRPILAGLLFGLAFCLRYQYAPALAIGVMWQTRRDWPRWRGLILGGLGVALPLGGLLDWITWGAPFQSIWMNYVINSVQGMSTAIGTESPLYYIAYLWVALSPFPILLMLAIIGGIRLPTLGLVATVALIEHLAVPHKEVRFIYLTIAIAPILVATGCHAVLALLAERLGSTVLKVGIPATLGLLSLLSWHLGTHLPLGNRWSFERAGLDAFALARKQPDLCALAVRDLFFDSGGYTYLHRDVPMYYADFDPARVLAGTPVTMRLFIMRHGAPVPQYPGAALAGASARYNYLVAQSDHPIAGFAPMACFNDAERGERPPLCLYRRPGGCS